MLMPSTSIAKINSCRLSLEICPALASQSAAHKYSSSVSSTSRTNACKWLISVCMIWRKRGVSQAPQRWTARSVRFSSVAYCMAPSFVYPFSSRPWPGVLDSLAVPATCSGEGGSGLPGKACVLQTELGGRGNHNKFCGVSGYHILGPPVQPYSDPSQRGPQNGVHFSP